MAKRKQAKQPAAALEVLGQIEPNAAGIDIGIEEIYVCATGAR